MVQLASLDLANKKVLIRVDFNVPLDKSGKISDDTRIASAIPTIEYALKKGAKVILMSHFGRPKGKSSQFSLAPCAVRLQQLLKRPVTMAPDCIGPQVEALVANMKSGDVILLENLRFYPAEEKPESDPTFAKNLAKLGDCYIDDAFGCAHRAHSSIVPLAQCFPGKAAAGFLMEKEIAFLGKALLEPKRPFFAIIGGAKISTKIGVLHALVEKSDGLFIGGAMAFTFFKAQGKAIGASLCEEEMVGTAKEIIAACQKKNIPLYLPVDTVATTQFDKDAPSEVFRMDSPKVSGIAEGWQGMDIGPKTIAVWKEALQKGKTFLWNGPVGVFEFPNFAKGTLAIAETLAALSGATTIAGGGETVAAIEGAGLKNRFSHISTGGGASLEYIEKGTLPGIEVLT